MAKSKYVGEVEARWLSDGRKMKLLKDVVFIDTNDHHWLAPAGSVIDGASIPREMWALTGSPFVGKYRRASVIHDVACVERTQTHEAVHRMFYEAMLRDGVAKGKARVMYIAVRDLGPRWDKKGKDLQAPDFWGDDNDDDF